MNERHTQKRSFVQPTVKIFLQKVAGLFLFAVPRQNMESEFRLRGIFLMSADIAPRLKLKSQRQC